MYAVGQLPAASTETWRRLPFMLTAVSLVWAGITHGWFVKCAACWCRLINGKPSATIETQTSMGARRHGIEILRLRP